MSEKSDSISYRMSGEELRSSWQGRALRLSKWTYDYGQMQRILLSLFADNYDEAMPFLLHAVSGSAAVYAPFYCSNPKINKRGHIVVDMECGGEIKKDWVVFESEQEMEGYFRRLADRLKLSDAERIDLFLAVRHWVKADQRLDPTMDRRDPEARRLVLN